MPNKTLCKTIHQYSKCPILDDDMRKLTDIAEDYRKVKNYVYQRYGGIRSLRKIYPGYTVQNEMTKSGLRAHLQLPSVYFYLAIFEALGDIKTSWSKVKNEILDSIKKNQQFCDADRHYIRFVMKVSGCFESIILQKEMVIPDEMQRKYEEVASGVDTEKLNRYLCRQVRRKKKKLHTEKSDGFSITEKAYRYKDHGIYIASKELRKRIFVLLTDENTYKKQLYVKLNPKKHSIEIAVPIEVSVRRHFDYQNKIGLSIGMWQMFTTDKGNVYGARYGEYRSELTDFISSGHLTYSREKENNPGREKYKAKKDRLDEKLKSYVNHEINNMLKEEKAAVIYIPKLPQSSRAGINRKINYSVTVWQRGYIMDRLTQKCNENSIKIVEVLGKGISTTCSKCGEKGIYEKDVFLCRNCGYVANKKINAARNAVLRGKSAQQKDLENYI